MSKDSNMNNASKPEGAARLTHISYLAFVLGYDILHRHFADSASPECDIVYEECVRLAEVFDGSEWDDESRPVYECLQDFACHLIDCGAL